MVDLLSTTAFTALIAGIAVAQHTYDSLPAVAIGLVAASISGFGLRRALRPVLALTVND
jgi:ABC-type transporter Mla maintaining outer membrane lipid asymmetry permease subunit MlaE